MVKVEKLKSPNIGVCSMNCDNVIDKKLLTYGPMVEQCFSKTNVTLVVGLPGSGKTSLVTQFLKTIYKKVFEDVYVIIPSVSRHSIKNNIYDKHLPEENLFDQLTGDVLYLIYDKAKENAEEGENTLLIIDDSQEIMKQKDIARALERLIIKKRHLHLTIFIMLQNFNAIDRRSRVNADNIIFFDLGKTQLEDLIEQVLKCKKAVAEDIIDVAFDAEHNWVCINKGRGKQKIYKMFDEIIYEE